MSNDPKFLTIPLMTSEKEGEKPVHEGEINVLRSRELGIMMVVSLNIFKLSIFDLPGSDITRRALAIVEQSAWEQGITELMVPMMPSMTWLGADLMVMGYTLNPVSNRLVTGMEAPGWFQKRLG